MKLSPKRFIILSLGVIIVSITIIYSNTINGEFQFDDTGSIVDNHLIKDFDTFKHISFWISPNMVYRPFSLFTFAINYNLWGLNVVPYHITNIFIHILVCISIYYLLYLIYFQVSNKKIDTKTLLPILLATLFFAIHPIQTQAVSYIVQRMTSLSMLFYCLSIITYIHFRIAINKKAFSLKSIILFLTIGVFCILALFSKQNAATIPIMIIFTELIVLRKSLPRFSNFILIFLGTLTSIAIIFFTIKISRGIFNHSISPYEYYASQCKAFFQYSKLILVPL